MPVKKLILQKIKSSTKFELRPVRSATCAEFLVLADFLFYQSTDAADCH